jgi:hypothetical protein
MIKMDGTRYRTDGNVQRYYCRRSSCRFSFTVEYARGLKSIDDLKLTRKFTTSNATLKELSDDTGLKVSTLNQRILRCARRILPVFEESKCFDSGSKCKVLGIDSTGISIGRKNKTYLYIANVLESDPLACGLIENEDEKTITAHLLKIRSELHCNPKIAICDLAPESIQALRNIWPEIIIQGCLFHAMLWLEKNLPTRNRIRGVDKKTVALWKEVKARIIKIIYATDMKMKDHLVRDLSRLDLHYDIEGRAKRTINNLLDNLSYYRPHDMLRSILKLQDLSRVIYNNVCESHFSVVDNLGRKMRGWKGRESFECYVSAYWHFRREERVAGTSNQSQGRLTLPLSTFTDCLNLEEYEEIGITREVLVNAATARRDEVVGDFVFSRTYVNEITGFIHSRIGKCITVSELLREFDIDEQVISDLLARIGCELNFLGGPFTWENFQITLKKAE